MEREHWLVAYFRTVFWLYRTPSGRRCPWPMSDDALDELRAEWSIW